MARPNLKLTWKLQNLVPLNPASTKLVLTKLILTKLVPTMLVFAKSFENSCNPYRLSVYLQTVVFSFQTVVSRCIYTRVFLRWGRYMGEMLVPPGDTPPHVALQVDILPQHPTIGAGSCLKNTTFFPIYSNSFLPVP